MDSSIRTESLRDLHVKNVGFCCECSVEPLKDSKTKCEMVRFMCRKHNKEQEGKLIKTIKRRLFRGHSHGEF